MAVLFMDGFDMYYTADAPWPITKRYTTGIGPYHSWLDVDGSNFSGPCMYASGNSGAGAYGTRVKFKQASDATAEIFVGFWFKRTAKPGASTFVGILNISELAEELLDYNDASSRSFSFTVDSNGYLGVQAWYSTNTAVDWTGSIDVCDSAWHFIEARLHWNDTTGDVETYVDGSADITQNLIDTIQSGSPPTFTGFEYLSINNQVAYYDDIVIYDVATPPTGTPRSGEFPLGEFKIETLVADSAGSSADFTSLTGGANYAETNATSLSVDILSSVYSQTTTDWDSYNFGSLSNTPTEIHTVVIDAYARRIGTGNAYIQLTAENNGTVTTGPSQAVTRPGRNFFQFEVPYDPDTATLWTGAGINAAEFGFKFSTT